MKPGSERQESWSERNFAQKAPLSVPFLFVRAYTPVLIAELNINHFWGGMDHIIQFSLKCMGGIIYGNEKKVHQKHLGAI